MLELDFKKLPNAVGVSTTRNDFAFVLVIEY